MEEYGLDRGSVSLLVTAVTFMVAVFTLPGGIIAASIGIRRAFTIGVFLMGAGVLTPFTSDFLTLLLLRVCYGIGVGVAIPVTSAVVMQWFRQRELPLMNGLNLTGQSIGVATSMFIGVPLAGAMGWRFPLLLYGALALVSGLAWVLLGRSPPKAASVSPKPSLRETLGVLKERTTLLLQLTVLGPFALYVALSSWLPSYYHEAFNMPLAKASSIAGLLPLVGIPATLLGGIMSARLGVRKPFVIVPGLLMTVAAFGTFLFDNTVVVYGSIILLGLCSWIYLPALFTIPLELPNMSPEKVAVVVGAALATGDLAASLSPFFVGAVTDTIGSFVPPLSVLAVFALTMLIGGMLLPETGLRAGGPGPASLQTRREPS